MPVATFNFVTDGATTTWTLTGSASTQKVLDTAEDAARYIYPKRYQLYEEVDGEQVPILFDDLTLAQKKAIIAREFVYIMLEYAKTYHKTHAIDVAGEAAEAEAEDKYGLE